MKWPFIFQVRLDPIQTFKIIFWKGICVKSNLLIHANIKRVSPWDSFPYSKSHFPCSDWKRELREENEDFEGDLA